MVVGKDSLQVSLMPPKAGEWACERYSEFKMMEKFGVNPSPRSFKSVADLAVKEMELELDSGYGKVIYEDYIRAINSAVS